MQMEEDRWPKEINNLAETGNWKRGQPLVQTGNWTRGQPRKVWKKSLGEAWNKMMRSTTTTVLRSGVHISS
jgi:hypothetical protein